MSHLRIFGSMAFVKTTGRLSKLEDRSKCMLFVGYEAGSKAYRCLDTATFKIHISRDVIFDEKKTFHYSGKKVNWENIHYVLQIFFKS